MKAERGEGRGFGVAQNAEHAALFVQRVAVKIEIEHGTLRHAAGAGTLVEISAGGADGSSGVAFGSVVVSFGDSSVVLLRLSRKSRNCCSRSGGNRPMR